mgnify:CR=1 FL=1
MSSSADRRSAEPQADAAATAAAAPRGVPTEPNVREHASLLRLVANSVPALMAFYDADTLRCLFANAAYARTFGFDEQTVLGRTLEEVPRPIARSSPTSTRSRSTTGRSATSASSPRRPDRAGSTCSCCRTSTPTAR